MALAPNRLLVAVPSSATSALSRSAWSRASMPSISEAISPLTFSTALRTPLPPYRLPPSRSSSASRLPVEAPEGTAARPQAPPSSQHSTSSVGLPRESRISRAWTPEIANIPLPRPRRNARQPSSVAPRVPAKPRKFKGFERLLHSASAAHQALETRLQTTSRPAASACRVRQGAARRLGQHRPASLARRRRRRRRHAGPALFRRRVDFRRALPRALAGRRGGRLSRRSPRRAGARRLLAAVDPEPRLG